MILGKDQGHFKVKTCQLQVKVKVKVTVWWGYQSPSVIVLVLVPYKSALNVNLFKCGELTELTLSNRQLDI